jgi:hypothetical protein
VFEGVMESTQDMKAIEARRQKLLTAAAVQRLKFKVGLVWEVTGGG